MASPLLLRALAAALAVAGPSLAQVPEYTAELIGSGVVVNDMNADGAVVGWTLDGGVQAFLARPGQAQVLLPLPAGYASAWAQGINDAGVVVGSASASSFPEVGQPCAWYPDGAGGHTVELLELLDGFTQGVAYDVNNRGDIVGWCLFPGFQGGPTTWFDAPGGPLNLADLGAPSGPKEINDEGVVVGISGPLFDIDTLSPITLPSLTGSFTGFQGWAVNDANEIAGKGFHGSQRSAASWTAAHGWVSHSLLFGISASVQSFDINADGVVVLEAPTPSVAYPGVGTFTLASRVAPASGAWSFLVSLGGAINDAGQIAAIGNGPGGQSGVVLLTPVGDVGFEDLRDGLAGSTGVPQLTGSGVLATGQTVSFALAGALPGGTTSLVLGLGVLGAPFKGGTLVPTPDILVPGIPTDSNGFYVFGATWPASVPQGAQLFFQVWIPDATGPAGFSATNGLQVTSP